MTPIDDPDGSPASDNHETTTPAQNPPLQGPLHHVPTDSPPPSEPDLLDPFHPEKLRLDQSHLDRPAGKKLLLQVPLRRPNDQTYFRVHPEYRISPAALVTLKDDRDTFLVDKDFVSELAPWEFHYATLYLVITRQEDLLIWPAKMAGPEGRPSDWYTSAAQVAEQAIKKWIKVVSNMALGCYEGIEADGKFPEPVWPEISFSEILKVAFRDRIIYDHSHTAIKRLRGSE